MNQTKSRRVTVNDTRCKTGAGRPDKCFYCTSKLGDEHQPECVTVDELVEEDRPENPEPPDDSFTLIDEAWLTSIQWQLFGEAWYPSPPASMSCSVPVVHWTPAIGAELSALRIHGLYPFAIHAPTRGKLRQMCDVFGIRLMERKGEANAKA